MKNLRNDRGIALVTALCLTLVALAIIMALLYMITWQSRLSGAHKRYKTAIEASQGGAEIFAKQVIPLVFAGYTTSLSSQFPGITLTPTNNSCLNYKLQNATASWSTVCGPDNDYLNPTNLDDPTKTADVTLNLQGTQSPFNVYAKVVDTIPGNSDTSGNDFLIHGNGTDGTDPDVAPKHIPAMYRIEVQGQMATNPLEKAKLSVLYAY
ncbi:MAG TPA: pilus assembly PilX N-terminal domain-containing protein [Geobacteraceae bacterium]